MRTLTLSKAGLNKLRSHQKELKTSDVEESIKSIPPGEWCFLNGGLEEIWISFVNSLIDEKFTCFQVLGTLKKSSVSSFNVEDFIKQKIELALSKRERFTDYKKGSRIFYGVSDGLPGLIIDQFKNAAIIQINTAGVDKFRIYIQEVVSKLISQKVYFLDNQKYREKESLPTFEIESVPDLEIEENGLKYFLRSEVMQKIGFYYDHRENRKQLIGLLERMSVKPESALDLFSYAGSWGLSALKGGVKHATFVDQGDFAIEVEKGLNLNNFPGQGDFKRGDVFKCVDEFISQHKKFDVILCDPPAFAKSALHKPQALEGYSKLHRKVFRIAEAGALCVFSSCTHYVSHEEFQKNISDAAMKENKKIQLLHCGMQGFDHPVSSLDDRSNYIKSYFYLLES